MLHRLVDTLRTSSDETLCTPVNFIYSCDTVGGNSGSPVLNADGYFVGINFDRPKEGLVNEYVSSIGVAHVQQCTLTSHAHTDTHTRTTPVHPQKLQDTATLLVVVVVAAVAVAVCCCCLLPRATPPPKSTGAEYVFNV